MDPLPELRRRAEQGERMYYRFDNHLNAAGHRCVAELIYDAPMESGPIDAEE